MGLEFFDGFEHYPLATQKWHAGNTVIVGSDSGVFARAGYGFGVSGLSGSWGRTLDPATTFAAIGAHIYLGETASFLRLTAQSPWSSIVVSFTHGPGPLGEPPGVQLYWSSPPTLEHRIAYVPYSIPTNMWIFFEATFESTVANVSANAILGGVPVTGGTHVYTVEETPDTDTTITSVGIDGFQFFVDNAYIVNGASPGISTTLGESLVSTIYPRGNGTVNEMTSSSGDANGIVMAGLTPTYPGVRYAYVTKYLTSSGAQTELYPCNASDALSIRAVQVCVAGGPPVAHEIAPVVELNGTVVVGEFQTPTHPYTGTWGYHDNGEAVLYRYVTQVFENDPEGNPWTYTTINAAQFGVATEDSYNVYHVAVDIISEIAGATNDFGDAELLPVIA
jgi:hypothetical protein